MSPYSLIIMGVQSIFASVKKYELNSRLHDCKVTMVDPVKGTYLWVFEKQGTLIMKVQSSQNRLYKGIAQTVKSKCLFYKLDETTNFWHTRLGHVNHLSMALMYKNKMVYDLPNVSMSRELMFL